MWEFNALSCNIFQTKIGFLKQNIQQQQANIQQQNLQDNQQQQAAIQQQPVVHGNQVDKAANQIAGNILPAVNSLGGQVGVAVKPGQVRYTEILRRFCIKNFAKNLTFHLSFLLDVMHPSYVFFLMISFKIIKILYI